METSDTNYIYWENDKEVTIKVTIIVPKKVKFLKCDLEIILLKIVDMNKKFFRKFTELLLKSSKRFMKFCELIS